MAEPPGGVVDAHLHLWDPRQHRHAWLAEHPPLDRPFLPADHRAAAQGAPLDGMVFVQADCAAGQELAEARWVAGLAASEPRLFAIVAAAPLERGDAVGAHLAALARLPLVRGVRRLLQDEREPGFCLRADFLRGIDQLAGHGFSFDICIRHWQLADAVALAERAPQVRFVLDHLGKPDIRAGLLDPWRAQLRAFAQLPNTWCKLSGLVTEADHRAWRPEHIAPYLDHALACFAPERLMFGSDWPVVLEAASWARWYALVQDALAGLPAAARAGILGGNARAFYRRTPGGLEPVASGARSTTSA